MLEPLGSKVWMELPVTLTKVTCALTFAWAVDV